jgi:hypothetical protein
MTGPITAGLRGTKIMGSISYTLVSSPRDSTRIVDLGRISNLHIFDFDQSLTSSFSCTYLNNSDYLFLKGILVNKPGISDGSGNQLTTGAETWYLLQT